MINCLKFNQRRNRDDGWPCVLMSFSGLSCTLTTLLRTTLSKSCLRQRYIPTLWALLFLQKERKAIIYIFLWVWWFGGFCCIHKGMYVLSVRLRRSSEPPSNFPNSKPPWRFWGSVVMNRRLSGSSWLRSTISVLREPPRVRLWIRRVFQEIHNISDIIE